MHLSTTGVALVRCATHRAYTGGPERARPAQPARPGGRWPEPSPLCLRTNRGWLASAPGFGGGEMVARPTLDGIHRWRDGPLPPTRKRGFRPNRSHQWQYLRWGVVGQA